VFGVQGSGFRDVGVGLWVWGFRVQGVGFRASGEGFRARGLTHRMRG